MTTATGPFTELNSRRLGPVRRFFVRRPRAMDALVVLVFLVGGLTSMADPAGRGTDSAGVVAGAAVVIALGAVALAFRRAQPVAVVTAMVVLAVSALALTGDVTGADLGVGLALYCVAASRPPRTAWVTAAVAVAVTAGAMLLWQAPTQDPVATHRTGELVVTDDRGGSIAGLVIVTLAAMAFGTSVRNRRQHLADLVDRANAFARDRDRQAELARAAERTRIAREMHDVVAHSLSVMVTLADGAGVALDRNPERARHALTELSATGRAALADMRRVLGALGEDGAPLEPTGQPEDLTTLVERFRTAGLPVHAQGLRLPPPDDTGLRLAVYRVVQEALTNALRHAPGTTRVDLTLQASPDRWVIDVVDHGAGVPVTDAGGAGLGLVGMRERVEVLGGTVDAGPWGAGWRVHVELPTPEAHR